MRKVTLALLLSLTLTSWADISVHDTTYLDATSQALTMSKVQYVGLNKAEQKSIANEWGITPDEYSQYLDLMAKSSSGSWYKTLDPAEILGINATDDDRREHFALIVARLAFERASRELAFQKAYDVAFKTLYGNIKPIALPHTANTNLQVLQSGDKLILFTGLDSDVSDNMINRLILLIQTTNNTSLNFFFTDASDDAIRSWAGAHHLPVSLVQDKRITLNHDNGLSAKWLNGQLSLPLLLRDRSGKLTPVSLEEGL